MRLSLPSKPKLRDFYVYDEVIHEGRTQLDAGARWSVSQPRVSRICKRVRQWLVKTRCVDNDLTPEQNGWLAHEYYIRQLQIAQQKALQAFEHGLEHFYETRAERKPNGLTKEKDVSQRRRGVGDPRLLTVYINAAQKMRDATIEEGHAAAEVQQQLAKDRAWAEDRAIAQICEEIYQARLACRRLVRRGYLALELPALTKTEICEYVRRKFREHPNSTTSELMPPAWQAVIEKLWQDPDILQRADDFAAKDAARQEQQRRKRAAIPRELVLKSTPEDMEWPNGRDPLRESCGWGRNGESSSHSPPAVPPPHSPTPPPSTLSPPLSTLHSQSSPPPVPSPSAPSPPPPPSPELASNSNDYDLGTDSLSHEDQAKIAYQVMLYHKYRAEHPDFQPYDQTCYEPADAPPNPITAQQPIPALSPCS